MNNIKSITTNKATGTLTIEVMCPFCKQTRQVIVPKAGFDAWKRGMLIQDALPNTSASDREGLLTGMCDELCFPKPYEE